MTGIGHSRGAAMTTAPTIIGINLGKHWFHLAGMDERGATVLRKKLNRGQLAEFAVTAPTCVVATEACPGSQYWGRIFPQAGHEAHFARAIREAVRSGQQERFQ
jgi:transposase